MGADDDTLLQPERFADLATCWPGARGWLSPLAVPDPSRLPTVGDVSSVVRSAMDVLVSPVAAFEVGLVDEAGPRTSIVYWAESGAEAAVVVDVDDDRVTLCTPASVRAVLAHELGPSSSDPDPLVLAVSARAALVLGVLVDLQRQVAIFAAAGDGSPQPVERRASDVDALLTPLAVLAKADRWERALSSLADEPAWAVTWLICTLLPQVPFDTSVVVAAVHELVEAGAAERRDGGVVLSERLGSFAQQFLVARRLLFLTTRHLGTEPIDEDELVCGLDRAAACWVVVDPDAPDTVRLGCGSITDVASLAHRTAAGPVLLRNVLLRSDRDAS